MTRLILFIVVCLAMVGCAGAWVKNIGTNRYQIEAMGGGFKSPDDMFIAKAKEVCPKGFKVIERHGTDILYGTIECE